MWHEISRLVECLEHLDAHVPDIVQYDKEEKTIFGTPNDVEDIFAEEFGDIIPQDYYDNFLDMIENFEDELVDSLNSRLGTNYLDMGCDILYCSIETSEFENALIIKTIKVRPCASGYGFYRLFMWMLGQIAIKHKFEKIVVSGVLSRNRRILQRMSFQVGSDDFDDASITIDKLKTIKKEDWNVPEPLTLPSAHKLNTGED
jgi:hypothetical protein